MQIIIGFCFRGVAVPATDRQHKWSTLQSRTSNARLRADYPQRSSERQLMTPEDNEFLERARELLNFFMMNCTGMPEYSFGVLLDEVVKYVKLVLGNRQERKIGDRDSYNTRAESGSYNWWIEICSLVSMQHPDITIYDKLYRDDFRDVLQRYIKGNKERKRSKEKDYNVIDAVIKLAYHSTIKDINATRANESKYYIAKLELQLKCDIVRHRLQEFGKEV